MLNGSDKTKESISEDEYSTFINSSDPVFVVDRRGRIADVNDAFCKQIGLKKHDILGKAKILTIIFHHW